MRWFLLPFFVGMLMISTVSVGSARADAEVGPPRRTAPLTPLELMANDKEENSVIVKAADREQAREILGNDLSALKPQLIDVASALATDIFNQPDNACEAHALSVLQHAAVEANLPAQINPQNEPLKSILVALRENDLIDDVILAPLWKSLTAYEHTPRLPTEHACPTATFFSIVGKLKSQYRDHYRKARFRKEVKNELRQKVISPEMAAWLNDLEDSGWEKAPYTLSSVALTMKSVKNIYLTDGQTSGKTTLASKKKKKTHGLSYRLAFYQRYNATQIDLMAKAFYRFNRRISAKKVYLTYDFEGDGSDTEVVHLSLTEQYDVAVNQLHNEYADVMTSSELFQGRKIEFEDLVLAGLETGYVPAQELNEILKIDDRWNPPEATGFRKVMTIIQKYGGPLLILVPPPFNMISSLSLVLVQSVILKDKKEPDPVKEGYSIF